MELGARLFNTFLPAIIGKNTDTDITIF